MKTLKRLLLMMVLAFAATQFVCAQSEVVVYLNDGTSQTFSVSDDGKLYFDASQLYLQTAAASSSVSTIAIATIRKIDFPGNSSGTTVTELATELPFVYPNPTRDVLYIGNVANNASQVSIYSMNGQQLYQALISTDTGIDVSSLKAGIYLIRIGNTTLKFSKF